MNETFEIEIITASEVIICPAGPDDADAVARLITQLGYPAGPDEIRRRLAVLSTRFEDHLTAIAIKHGQTIGVIAAAFGFHLELSSPFGRITALSVDADYRNQGIGACLLEHAEAWLRKKGVDHCIVNSHLRRRDAHRFYESNGYLRTGYRLTKSLM